MDQKRPDPLEEFTVLPQIHYLDLNNRGRTREGKGKRKKRREREEGVWLRPRPHLYMYTLKLNIKLLIPQKNHHGAFVANGR